MEKYEGIHPGWFEREMYTQEELEFLIAIDRFKRVYQRPFPSWQDVLSVFKSMGYRKVAEPESLPRPLCGKDSIHFRNRSGMISG